MKRVIGILTASLMASAMALTPVMAQGNSGNAMGNSNSASDLAPGHEKGMEGQATDFAPGQMKDDDESAQSYAPGQMKDSTDAEVGIDTETTASTGQPNFGTLISTIHAGKTDLSQISPDAEVEVVEVNDLIEGGNREALDNAMAEVSESDLSDLRASLADVEALDDADAQNAIAAEVGVDGKVTVFVDEPA